mmetsp:Transcript_697/g.947  ORF Transcript_697/g.947 Transcript_697/m.947 type:complete len:340 (+) Transcript_697:1-1020(+)
MKDSARMLRLEKELRLENENLRNEVALAKQRYTDMKNLLDKENEKLKKDITKLIQFKNKALETNRELNEQKEKLHTGLTELKGKYKMICRRLLNREASVQRATPKAKFSTPNSRRKTELPTKRKTPMSSRRLPSSVSKKRERISPSIRVLHSTTHTRSSEKERLPQPTRRTSTPSRKDASLPLETQMEETQMSTVLFPVNPTKNDLKEENQILQSRRKRHKLKENDSIDLKRKENRASDETRQTKMASKRFALQEISMNKGEIACLPTVRGRRNREALQGFDCTQCREWYEVTKDTVKGAERTLNTTMCNHTSRHRRNCPIPKSPKGIWSISFSNDNET